MEASRFHDLSLQNTMKSDVDIRKVLFDNVVLHHRVSSDRRTLDQGVLCVGTIYDEIRVVVVPFVRRCSVRIGGSI